MYQHRCIVKDKRKQTNKQEIWVELFCLVRAKHIGRRLPHTCRRTHTLHNIYGNCQPYLCHLNSESVSVMTTAAIHDEQADEQLLQASARFAPMKYWYWTVCSCAGEQEQGVVGEGRMFENHSIVIIVQTFFFCCCPRAPALLLCSKWRRGSTVTYRPECRRPSKHIDMTQSNMKYSHADDDSFASMRQGQFTRHSVILPA